MRNAARQSEEPIGSDSYMNETRVAYFMGRCPLLSRAASDGKFGLSGIFQPLRITSGGCKSVVCNSAFLHTARLVATRHPTGSWD